MIEFNDKMEVEDLIKENVQEEVYPVVCFYDSLKLDWHLKQLWNTKPRYNQNQSKSNVKSPVHCFLSLSAQVLSSSTWIKMYWLCH